jgi:uncharacterized protein YqcC (DUF446 family)
MTYEDLSAKLDAIEAELRNLGYLEGAAGEPQQVSSAFGMNEMSFEGWLARVFVPTARQRIAEKDLPVESQIGIAAIRNFDGLDEAAELTSLLCEFDHAVEEMAGKRPRRTRYY